MALNQTLMIALGMQDFLIILVAGCVWVNAKLMIWEDVIILFFQSHFFIFKKKSLYSLIYTQANIC